MEPVFRVCLPDGRVLKPMGRDKILRGFNSGKIPAASLVQLSSGRFIDIAQFCTVGGDLDNVLIVAKNDRQVIESPQVIHVRSTPAEAPEPRRRRSNGRIMLLAVLIAILVGYSLPRVPLYPIEKQSAIPQNTKARRLPQRAPEVDRVPQNVPIADEEIEPMEIPEPVRPKRERTEAEKAQAMADELANVFYSKIDELRRVGQPGQIESTIIDDRVLIQVGLEGPTFTAKFSRPDYKIRSLHISFWTADGFGGRPSPGAIYYANDAQDAVAAMFSAMERLNGIRPVNSQVKVENEWVGRWLKVKQTPQAEWERDWEQKNRAFGGIVTSLERIKQTGSVTIEMSVKLVEDDAELAAIKAEEELDHSMAKRYAAGLQTWLDVHNATRGIPGFDVQPEVTPALLSSIEVGASMVEISELLSSNGRMSLNAGGVSVVEWEAGGVTVAKIAFEDGKVKSVSSR